MNALKIRTRGIRSGRYLNFAATEAEIRELQSADVMRLPLQRFCRYLHAKAKGEQAKIFAPSVKGRRIIIATNVAETALTVPNIRYVIDLGFARFHAITIDHASKDRPSRQSVKPPPIKEKGGAVG